MKLWRKFLKNIQKKKVNGINNIVSCKKININIEGNNNKIIADNCNISCISKNLINIIGNNNIVKIDNDFTSRNILSIQIIGDNNKITLEKNINVVDMMVIQILENCENAIIHIGEDTSFWHTMIQTCDNNSSIEIGKDCMFSYNTSVLNGDGHSIFQNGQLINSGKDLKIGNHCWIGYNSTIYKNSNLPNDTIVARDSLVTSSSNKFIETNTAMAGSPAKLIKTNLTWNRKTPNQTMKEKF